MGVTVEFPDTLAAVDKLAHEADFRILGTNDLTCWIAGTEINGQPGVSSTTGTARSSARSCWTSTTVGFTWSAASSTTTNSDTWV
ncbi:putative PEP-binding protein [Yinghuangia aomiensis]|uniref:putative PEP-binding protein n=1 Tax=Yinghuangia aomiensis TaxID=676205 RepID=UPI003CD0BD70